MPESRIIGLTRETANDVRAVIDDFKKDRSGTLGGGAVETDYTGPQVYIAEIPEGGIPAMTGTTPGAAACAIYKIVGGFAGMPDEGGAELIEVFGASRVVYNISGFAIAGSSRIPVIRDAYGRWLSAAPIPAPGGNGFDYYRHVGDATLVNPYYPSPAAIDGNQQPVNPPPNIITALPYPSVRGGTIDRLGAYQLNNSGPGQTVRFAIYRATSDTDLWPSELVVETDALDVTAGISSWKVGTINVTLAANTLYWLCVNCNLPSSGFAVSFTGTQSQSMRSIFGWGVQGGATPGQIIRIAQAYGPYPATFPAKATLAVTNTSLVTMPCVRYSA